MDRPVPMPPAGGDSAATRYLCAAAHLDARFADRVVRELIEEPHRAVGPSYGIDLLPILRHCLAARRRRLWRDLALLGLALLLLFTVGFQVLIVWVVWVMVAAWLRARRASAAQRQQTERRIGSALSAVALVTLVLLLVAFLPMLQQSAYYGLGPFAPGAFPSPLELVVATLGALVLLLLPVLLLAAPVLADTLLAWQTITTRLQPGNVQPPEQQADVPAATVRRLEGLQSSQYGNVTVYSGYDPFVGAGRPVSTWSFAVDLAAPAKPELPPSPIDLVQLMEHIRTRLEERLERAMREAITPRAGLTLAIEQRAFVHGADLAGTPLLADPAGPPATEADRETLAEAVYRPTGTRRHYLCVQARLWHGEVISSTFLYLDIRGSTLYVEASRYALYPVTAAYHLIDELPQQLRLVRVLRWLGRSLLETPSAMLRAPAAITRTLLSPYRAQARRRAVAQALAEGIRVDYGARGSVREFGADASYHHYFQELDAIEAWKLVELHVLEAIPEFLDAHGISTEVFRARQEMILNNFGVLMGQGGAITAGALAVGTAATASGGTVTSPAASGGTAR